MQACESEADNSMVKQHDLSSSYLREQQFQWANQADTYRERDLRSFKNTTHNTENLKSEMMRSNYDA